MRPLVRVGLNALVSIGVMSLAVPAVAQAQEARVQGVVLDARTGVPLAGAAVHIPALRIGTLADAAGRYVLSGIPAGEHELRAELIGRRMERQTVSVAPGATVNLNFQLDASAIGLDEILVTGTPAATARREIGVAINQIAAATVVESSAIAKVSELLENRAPGAVIMAQGGQVGTGSVIKLRGTGSISLTNQPIIYIDGVRVDNQFSTNVPGGSSPSRWDDINPADIETLEIIKGPAASTLYGTEASNGVIQIITKRGRAGEKAQITASIKQGGNWMMSPETEYPINYALLPNGTVLSQRLYTDEQARGFDVLQTGQHQEYALSARGGTSDLGYFLSTSFEDKEGIYVTNTLKKFTARANVNAQLRENLTLNSSMGFTTQDYTRAPEGGSVSYGILTGIIWGSPAFRDTPTRGFLRAPWEETYKIKIGQDVEHFTWSGTLDHRASDWFTHRLTVGIDAVDEMNYRLYPRMPEGAAHFFGSLALGQRLATNQRRENRTLDYAATATFDVSQDLNSATSFGIQYFARSDGSVTSEGRVFPAPGLETVSAGAQKFGSETFVENKTFGMFVQERLAWKNRLFLTMAIRADDNSAFGVEVDPALYPKLSGVWVVSEEPFWNVDFLRELRLRGAWGTAGQQPDALASIRTFGPVAGVGGGAALLPLNPGNPKLKPERGEELELGFDASLWDRITMAFTYYAKKTKDAIIFKNVPPSTGFSGSQYVNIGEMANWGQEVELNAEVIQGERFGWDLGVKFAHTKNEILDLGGLPPISTGQGRQQIWHKEGYPIGGFWNKKIVDATWDPVSKKAVNILCDGGPGQAPMDCAKAPLVYLGGPGPYWDVVATTGVSVGNLRLTALVDMKFDQRKLNVQAYGWDYLFFNGWAVTHPAEADPTYVAAIQMQNLAPLVQRIDWIKLREIGANYELPAAWAARLFGASRASVSLSGRNLWRIWRHKEDTTCCNEAEIETQESWIRQTQTITAPQALLIGGVTITF